MGIEKTCCELTKRDEEIVVTLTQKVRLLSLGQILATWWPVTASGRRAGERRLQRLCEAGWLLRDVVHVHPLLPLTDPMFAWRPGARPPRYASLAGRLRSRWTQALVCMRVYLASQKAARHWGGFGGRHRHRTQLTHDLHLALVFLQLRQADPPRAQRWVGEELLDQLRDDGKLPDAVIMGADGETPEEVVEFGGTYGGERIGAFHRFCEERKLAYQLW